MSAVTETPTVAPMTVPDTTSGTTAAVTGAKKPVTVFTATERPADWANLSFKQKMVWLDTQPLPSDPTVSLGACHRRGANLTKSFQILCSGMRMICKKVAKKDESSKVKIYCTKFIAAFNQGIGTFSTEIYDDCTELLSNGKYSDEGKAAPPVKMGAFLTLDDDEPAQALIAEKPEEDSFWKMFKSFMELLCENYPFLNEVRPPMSTSYAALFTSVIVTGQEFFKEYFAEEASQQAGSDKQANVPVMEQKKVEAAKEETAKHEEEVSGKVAVIEHEDAVEVDADSKVAEDAVDDVEEAMEQGRNPVLQVAEPLEVAHYSRMAAPVSLVESMTYCVAEPMILGPDEQEMEWDEPSKLQEPVSLPPLTAYQS